VKEHASAFALFVKEKERLENNIINLIILNYKMFLLLYQNIHLALIGITNTLKNRSN
jgi:hypothetical protein